MKAKHKKVVAEAAFWGTVALVSVAAWILFLIFAESDLGGTIPGLRTLARADTIVPAAAAA